MGRMAEYYETVHREQEFEESGMDINLEGKKMNLEDIYPSKSQHLKCEDLKGRDVKCVIDGHDIAKFDDGSKLVLKLKGKEKTFVLNKTNANRIGATFGQDPTEWNGKEIIIYPDKTDFGGKMVDCLRVRIQSDDNFDDEIPF